MAWIMNSVESCIAPTIAYYTKAKDMWSFLKKTYSHATNVIKISQLEEELCNIRQGDQDLPQYFATLTAAYELLKALHPPCKHCYASHFETGMVAKFLSRLSSEYSVAKSQILIGGDLPDLADTYNRLSHLAVTLTQSMHDTPVSALVMSGGPSHSSFVGTRGRGAGRERFQCSYCGKLGHLEDRCWDKHHHLRSAGPPGRGGGRTSTGKGSCSSTATSSQATASMVEPPTCSPSYSLNLSKEEYELVLTQRSTPALTNTAAIDSAFSVGAPTSDLDQEAGGTTDSKGLAVETFGPVRKGDGGSMRRSLLPCTLSLSSLLELSFPPSLASFSLAISPISPSLALPLGILSPFWRALSLPSVSTSLTHVHRARLVDLELPDLKLEAF
ncbi:hypothetical protein EJ110_NYTH49086 [Nymphaea thermarum]|nr:hypothetical protein EJ110_NYTH49086 [Nymphaea thermarum]